LSVQRYVSEPSPGKETNYSLWKAARRLKGPKEISPPIKREDGSWARSEADRAETFAEHLEKVFRPNGGSLSEQSLPIIPEPEEDSQLSQRLLRPIEVAKMIDGLNHKKAPGLDGINGKMLKELPRKGIVMLTVLFNAILRLGTLPGSWKKAKVIMIRKPGKPPERAASYRPISLLSTPSKVFERLLLKKILPILEKKKIIPEHQFGFRHKHSKVDQLHRVIHIINKALEEKKFCSGIFVDLAQAFDRVWHPALKLKITSTLPKILANVVCSYLENRTFRVEIGGEHSSWRECLAGVPQGGALSPYLYLIYTADMPAAPGVTVAQFADDTAVLAIDSDYISAIRSLQSAVNKIIDWTKTLKIAINGTKSVHVDFTLRCYSYQPVEIEGQIVPHAQSTRYLGVHLDSRLNWREHIRIKKLQIKEKVRELYWLIGPRSVLNLESKRLLYLSIIKPIWLYGAVLWGCASKTNIDVIQRCQNSILRSIVNAYRYERNDAIHRDLRIATVAEVIRDAATKHEERLSRHTNLSAIQLLDNSEDIRRLKRFKPLDLPCRRQ
jgi:hypothetical protein